MTDITLAYDPIKNVKRNHMRGLNEAKGTPVVLVCIYNQHNAVITHEVLYEVFCSYGKILRILIFEKLKVWKAFVEYDNQASANKAKKELNDYQLLPDGTRMNVYFANVRTIQFHNNNAGGKDYTLEESQQESQPGCAQESATSSSYGDSMGTSLNHFFPKSRRAPSYSDSPGEKKCDSTNANSVTSPDVLDLIGKEIIFDERDDDILAIVNDYQDSISPTKGDDTPSPDNAGNKRFTYDNDAIISSPFLNKAFQSDAFQFDAPMVRIGLSKFSNQANSQTFSDASPISSYNASTPMSSFSQAHSGYSHDMSTFDFSSFDNSSSKRSHQRSHTLTKINGLPFKFTGRTAEDALNRLSYNNGNNNSPMGFGMAPGIVRARTGPNPIKNFIAEQQQQTAKKTRNNLTNLNKLEQRPSYDSSFGSSNQLLPPPPIFGAFGTGFKPSSSENLLAEGINPYMRTNSNNSVKSFVSENSSVKTESTTAMNQNRTSNPQKAEENSKRSQVIYIKGFDNPEVNVQMIFNIFSSIGNVAKVLHVKEKLSALVEFENVEYAAIAKEYLDNVTFMGTALKIYWLSLSIANQATSQHTSNNEVFISVNPKDYQFEKADMTCIVPPTMTLQVSNLPAEACKEEFMMSHVGKFGRVESVQFFNAEDEQFCKVKMASISESLKAMACLNGSDCINKKLQVSFI